MNRNPNNQRKITFGTLAMILFFILGLTGYRMFAPAFPKPVAAQEQLLTTNQISDLVEHADIIVSGRPVRSLENNVNFARDPENPEQEDPILFIAGQIFEVIVDEYIKGDGAKVIFIVQTGGWITPASLRNNAAMQKARQMVKVPLKLGDAYILFLSSYETDWGVNVPEPLFRGTLEPWRFNITNPEAVVPESESSRAVNVYFPRQNLGEFVDLIKNPTGAVLPTSTPASTPDLSPYYGERPPPAVLNVDEQEQTAGVGTSTWNGGLVRGAIKITHSDAFGLVTPAEPITVTSPFTATLHLPIPMAPYILKYGLAAASPGDRWEVSRPEYPFEIWGTGITLSGEGLALAQHQDIFFCLEPGQYLLMFRAEWSSLGSTNYGFYLDVISNTCSASSSDAYPN